MAFFIHAQLDDDSDTLRIELQRQLGWTDSQIVREGIKSLSTLVRQGGKRRIVGLGRFKSGVSNLASNKKRLRGFGK